MRTRRRQQGLTLIELLIGMVLVGVIMTALMSLNISTGRSSSAIQVRNGLLAETQTSQNYVVGKLREAAYVFPATTTLALGSSYSVQNPVTGTGSWTVGTHPIVAFVSPPRTETPVTGGCAGTSTPVIPSQQACYTLYAYFPVKRSVVTGSGVGAANPGADAYNDASVWMLMEYRRTYPTITALSQALASGVGGGEARMVMDYLRPPATGETLFSQVDAPGTGAAGVTNVTLSLAALRGGGGAVRVPTSGRYNVTVYPRNVGKPVVPH